mgnify:CR=1 FL=1
MTTKFKQNIGKKEIIENVKLSTGLSTKNLQEIIDSSPQALEIFEAPLQASIQANVELDVRYLFYIKKYGPPPGGVFDPVKLQEFVVTGSGEQDHIDELEDRYSEVPDYTEDAGNY